MRKKDFILIFVVSLIIAGAFGVNYFVNTKNVDSIEIYMDNKLYKTYDINDKEEIKIKSKEGYNIVKIHDKGVEIIGNYLKRGEEEILPRGNTEIKPGDYLVIIADLNKEAIIRKEIFESNIANKK